jgi:poly-gamma-glutamate synthesis protein (capsule biosynthesis protein)
LKKLSLIFAAIFMVAGIFLVGDMVAARITSSVPVANENVIPDSEIPVSQAPEPVEHTPIPEDTTITIIAAGDIMFHYPQVISAKTEDGSYDFSSPFEFIKGYVQSADLAIANLETVIAGDGEAPKGYPRFRSPNEVLDGIKEAGFDVLVTANNHSADRGKAGIIKTIEEIEKRQLEYVGTSKEEKRDFIIKEIKGVKIGLLSYTFGLNGLESLLTQEELQRMVNLTDKEKISISIDEARSNGAELIVIYLHWGNEYHRQSSVEQRELAAFLAENGADIILGSHPHVVQELDVITSDQKEVPVIYSMGNLLSNQRYETMGVSYTEDGLMISLIIVKDGYTGELTIESVTPIPTWVNRWSAGNGRFNYRIIPVNDVLSGDLKLEISPESLLRIQKSLNDTMDTLDGLD